VAEGGGGIRAKKSNGLERDTGIMKPDAVEDFIPNSWSLDDKQLLYTEQAPGQEYLSLLSIADQKKARFEAGKSNQTNGQISPDGKWVAYASDESGTWEVYVTSFPDAAGKWQVSRGGGSEPRWRGDGKEMYYLAPSGMLMAVPVNAQGTFATGEPASLFQIHGRAPISSTDVFTYDVTKDGKRFLVNRYVKPDHVAPLTILLNVPSP
jgi:hypothetical protein